MKGLLQLIFLPLLLPIWLIANIFNIIGTVMIAFSIDKIIRRK